MNSEKIVHKILRVRARHRADVALLIKEAIEEKLREESRYQRSSMTREVAHAYVLKKIEEGETDMNELGGLAIG